MQAFLQGTARHSSGDHVCGRLKDKARPVPSVGAQVHVKLEELDPGRKRLLSLCHMHSGSMNKAEKGWSRAQPPG